MEGKKLKKLKRTKTKLSLAQESVLISKVQDNKVLWNPRHSQFKNTFKRAGAW